MRMSRHELFMKYIMLRNRSEIGYMVTKEQLEEMEKHAQEIDRRLKILDFVKFKIKETGSCTALDIEKKKEVLDIYDGEDW